MELVYFLLGLQAFAASAGGLYLWRNQQRQRAEIAALCEALAEAEARSAVKAQPRRRAAAAAAEVITINAGAPAETSPHSRAQQAWRLAAAPAAPAAQISAETTRGLALGVLALAPALGLAFGAELALVVACGLVVGSAMLACSVRPGWSAAAWAGVATAAGWGLLGLTAGSAPAAPVSYSICATLAGTAGLIQARMRRPVPGAAMALAMAAATLALGTQVGMVSAAGAAFAAVVATAAIIGAMSLRLEGMYLSAFVASLLGLFILSGQDSAAIWFTPAAALTGALFFAIAAVRVPLIGARGAAIAGVGVLAPLVAIAALYVAQQGLTDRFAAAGAFAALAALIVALMAAAVMHNQRGPEALKLTLWVLAAGLLASCVASVSLALPAPASALLLALAAFALAFGNLGLPSRFGAAFACACAGFAVLFATTIARLVLTEASSWPAFTLIGIGVAAPALVIGAAAFAAERRQALFTSGLLELVAALLALAAASLAVRVIYSGGAPMLSPISFAEVGAHASALLAGALLLRWRARRGIRPVRMALANLLWACALVVLTLASALWVFSFWATREAAVPFVGRDTLGFLVPAILLFANWRVWRSKFENIQARASLGAGALLLAAFVSVEVARADGQENWIGAVIASLAFATAIGVNFVPGVVRRQS